uniref:Variant surface glycoprotein 1125.199 n=1 Tax=Trypanosoma brucei TaxID=5691 RepID=A0A1J0R5D6_9TRYP|nr:variant surface glycoprotein 1125.199 [Trypanosoma brucei]
MANWAAATATTIAVLYVTKQADATYEALEFQTWNTHCSLAASLRKVPAGILANLESQVSYRSKLQEMETKLRIYALITKETQEQTETALLADTAAAMRLTKRQSHAGDIRTAIKAVGFAAEGAGAVTSYLMTIGSLTHNTQTYCLSNERGNANGKESLAAAGCRHATAADFDAGPGPDDAQINAEGFAQVPGKTANANSGQTSKCGFFTHTANPEAAAGIFITSASSKPSFGYGLLKVTDTDTTEGLRLTDIKGKNSDEDQKFWSSCHAAVQAGAKIKGEPPQAVGAQLLAELVASDEMQTVLKVTAAASQQKPPDQVTVSIASAKAAYFGSDNKKLEALWTKIKGENVVDLNKTGGSTKELGAVTDPTELQKLLSYYYTIRKEEQQKTATRLEKLETELADQKSKSPEAECNKIFEEPKCSAEKICSWSTEVKAGEKNCQFNSTKAKEKGVSVTQTQTGGEPETITQKCKGKPEKDCKDGCKWENNACKDSSILTNKHIALSVLSAAFTALLF